MSLRIEAQEGKTIYFSDFLSKEEDVQDVGAAIGFEGIAAGRVLAGKKDSSKSFEDLCKDNRAVCFVFANKTLKVNKNCFPEDAEPFHSHGLVFTNYSETAKSGQS